MDTPTTANRFAGDARPDRERWIATWLYTVVAMVFVMVVLGGVTRLTHSGLSMVEWRPITGWLPPMTHAEWVRVFELYKTFPEYKAFNQGMTLTEFEGIFWLEFLHRLWGRVIGVAFALPFVFFLVRGWVSRTLGVRLTGLFILGGLQGVMGWFMVKSGLVDEPDVSHYRLAAHLSLALLIVVVLIWVGRGLNAGLRERWQTADRAAFSGLRRGAAAVLALVFVTALSGALVAGLDAGLSYNTFPLMDGALIPDGLADLSPGYLNLFENRLTVQFDHRVLAITTLLAVFALWLAVRRRGAAGPARRAADLAMAVAALQVTLGISTLLLVVPVPLAAAHQAGAVALLASATWTLRDLCPPAAN
ncbi:MAG: COX15/CtaA family protein [Rhodospirillaceae bacterium]